MKKKFNNFIIGGVPRSGSHFIAEALNTSDTWTVIPEHKDDFGRDFGKNPVPKERWIRNINKRCAKNNYGEASPQLLKVLGELNVSKKVCVYRHPYEFLLSTFNRRNYYAEKFQFVFGNWYIPFYYCVDRYIREGMYNFKFESLFSDANVLEDLCGYLGIVDLSVENVNLKRKVNSAESHKQKNKWTSLTMLNKNQFEKLKELDWFCKRYYGDTIQSHHASKK